MLMGAALAGVALVGGCGQPGKVEVSADPPRPVDEVDEITVSLSPPTPVNWDDKPGPDGLHVRVYFFRIAQPLPVTVAGTLEFLLYAGKIKGGGTDARPLRVWTFTPNDLRNHLGRGIVGWGYGMRLPWTDSPPAAPSLTLLARYRPAGGQARSSAPIHVAMGPR